MRRGTTPTLQITVTGLSKIEIQVLHLIIEQQVTAGYTSGGTVSLTDDIETALAAI